MPVILDTKPKAPPLAEGLYQGVLAEVVDFGEIQGKFDEYPKRKVQLVFQLEALRQDGRRQEVRTFMENATFGKKANLRRLVAGMIGEPALDAALKEPTFDLGALVGTNCNIVVKHNATGEYANIGDILTYRGNAPMSVSDDYVPLQSRENYKPPENFAAPADLYPNPDSNSARVAALQGGGNGQGAPANPPQAPNYVPPAPTAAATTAASDEQIGALEAQATRAGYSHGELNEMTRRQFKVAYYRVTSDQAAQLLSTLRTMPSHPDAITAKVEKAKVPVATDDDELGSVFDDEPGDEPVLLQETPNPAAAVTPARRGAKA